VETLVEAPNMNFSLLQLFPFLFSSAFFPLFESRGEGKIELFSDKKIFLRKPKMEIELKGGGEKGKKGGRH
jgi:hypothetical protein